MKTGTGKSAMKKTKSKAAVQKTHKINTAKKTKKYVTKGSSKASIKSKKMGQKIKKTVSGTKEIFNLKQFIDEKFGNMKEKSEKKIVSDSRGSSLADLSRFNITLAHSFYKVTDLDSLEVTLLALLDPQDIDKLDLSPRVSEACSQVARFRDLLLLGDLPTITQEMRPYEWVYKAPAFSMPAQVALMTSFVSLAIKLTGKRPNKFNMKVPGGKLSGRARGDVVSYLALMRTIADSMASRNNYEKLVKFSQLNTMRNDLAKIINDF